MPVDASWTLEPFATVSYREISIPVLAFVVSHLCLHYKIGERMIGQHFLPTDGCVLMMLH
jgi:hypothetical protein